MAAPLTSFSVACRARTLGARGEPAVQILAPASARVQVKGAPRGRASAQGRGERATHLICAAAAGALEAPAAPGSSMDPSQIRNIAIIAHVDHGKTTLVDAMLKQSNIFRSNQRVEERIMDSNDLERERGITILAKNTAIRYRGNKINIIDTPGHADFGGEVERVLNMCDGVLLLVDSVEGPMPQTRFVLKKALDLEKKVVVVVNKIDRPAARPDWVLNEVFDLFVDLGANDDQCDFPVVYASGFQGIAGFDPEDMRETLEPLFETIVDKVSPPRADIDKPLQMLVTNIDYDDHKGRIAIGRVTGGTVTKGATVGVMQPDTDIRKARIQELFVFDNFSKSPVDVVSAGDICAICGLGDVTIGDTIVDPASPMPLPAIKVEEPTVRMTFAVNTSPFAGQEGKFVTSRNLKDRLDRELERNLALRVEPGETADQFVVSGRGALHLGILIENMRREGYEFSVGAPTVITKLGPKGEKLEPYDEAVIEVPEEYMGGVATLMGGRKGEMKDMVAGAQGAQRVTYTIPTRCLLGLKNAMLTATKGTAVLNTNFSHYGPWCGDVNVRENGSLVAHETGQVTAYALKSVQERGVLFVRPGDKIYEGQVIGIHQRYGDLRVNACKAKQLTNMRAAGKDATVVLDTPKDMSLDDAIEYIVSDELVEVTPQSVRVRKVKL